MQEGLSLFTTLLSRIIFCERSAEGCSLTILKRKEFKNEDASNRVLLYIMILYTVHVIANQSLIGHKIDRNINRKKKAKYHWFVKL